MQNKIFRFNLDIKEKEFKTDFNLVQLDNTSMLVIKLFDEGNKVETTKEDRAEIAIDKNDNTFCVLPCNLYENEVNCTLDSNALASPGWTNCEVRIINEGKVLTSARFKIYIRENIVNNEKIKSTTEYKALDELINEAKSMQESLKKGETVIEDVNKIKNDLTEIKESILNKSKEINNNLAVADEKINLIKTYISKSETAIENLTKNQNKIENLSNLLKELNKIQLTLDELNKSINNANTQKTELNTSIESAKTEKSNLETKIADGKQTVTNLQDKTSTAKTMASNLEGINRTAGSMRTSLESINETSMKTIMGLNEAKASGDLTASNLEKKIATGTSLNSKLETSISNAGNIKKDLDGSISNAESTNTTLKATDAILKATDTEAKNTESLIRDLINQLDLSKDEINKIIANGDLSKYITEPKLEEELKDYAKKEDALTKLDTTTYATDEENNIFKVTAKIKAGQLENELSNVGKRVLNDFYVKNVKITANQKMRFKAKSSEKGVILVYDKDEVFKHAIHVFGNLNEYEITPLKEASGDVELIFATVTMPDAEVEIIDFEVI